MRLSQSRLSRLSFQQLNGRSLFSSPRSNVPVHVRKSSPTLGLLLECQLHTISQTVLTDRPLQTTSEAICDKLPTYPPFPDTKHPVVPLYVTFLVTPSFAKWATNPDLFIRPALEKIFAGSVGENSEVDLHSTVAVVDGIPRPALSATDAASARTEDYRKNRFQRHEGVSLLLTTIGIRSTKCARNTFRLRFGECGDADNTLTVYASAYRRDAGLSRTAFHSPHISSIQLPLTNTTFYNGLRVSASSYRWKMVGRDHLQFESSETLEYLRLYWPFMPLLAPGERHLSLSARLLPLTSPRLIESSMGNVVRSISKMPHRGKDEKVDADEGTDEKSFPASKELEHAITVYTAARATEADSLDVWALIIPREVYERDYQLLSTKSGVSHFSPNSAPQSGQKLIWSWNKHHFVNDKLLFTLIQQGAHLHKVTSGGGGWGNRAGLLSLKPEYGFGYKCKMTSGSAPSNGDSLPSIASPGNFIQFFLRHSDESGLPDINLPKDGDDRSGYSRSAVGAFNVLPEGTDNYIESQSAEDVNEAPPTIEAYGSYFGASSAKGIAMGLSQVGNYQKRMRKLSKSMIDVPGLKVLIKANGGHAWISDQSPDKPSEFRSSTFHDGTSPRQEAAVADGQYATASTGHFNATLATDEVTSEPRAGPKNNLRDRRSLLAEITRRKKIRKELRKEREKPTIHFRKYSVY